MEVIPAYERLLGQPPKFLRKLEKFAPACSGLVLHLGTDRIYDQLAHHNFFYSKNQNKHFDTVFKKGQLPDDPTIYLVAPTRTDPTKAPEGCDNIKVLPHIPPIDPDNPLTREDYLEFKERIVDKLERMGLTDLRKHTIIEDVLTPLDIGEMYNSNRGSIYGVRDRLEAEPRLQSAEAVVQIQEPVFHRRQRQSGWRHADGDSLRQKVCDRILKREGRA